MRMTDEEVEANLAKQAASGDEIGNDAQVQEGADVEDDADNPTEDDEQTARQCRLFRPHLLLCTSQVVFGLNAVPLPKLASGSYSLQDLVRIAEKTGRAGIPTDTPPSKDEGMLARALYGSPVFKAALSDAQVTVNEEEEQRQDSRILPFLARLCRHLQHFTAFSGATPGARRGIR